VGMHLQGFERLVKKMDEIAKNIDEEVVIQRGYTKFKPEHAKCFDFKREDYLNEIFKESRLIISHAGAGTILTIMSLGKPCIIVPRLKKYDEHIDDQQIELAEHLKHKGIKVTYDVDELESFIKNIENKIISYRKNYLIVNKILEFLNN